MFQARKTSRPAQGGRDRGCAARIETGRPGSRWPCTGIRLLVLMLGLLLGLASETAAAEAAPHDVPQRLIVRFRSEGARALEGCAETLLREGRPFASATADGSRSLDELNARLGVRRIRAVFRRPDDRPIREQRARLGERLARRPSRARAAPRAVAAERLAALADVYTVEIGEDTVLAEAVALYAADPHVVWAQRDHTHVPDALPDDPFLTTSGAWGQPYADLWGLHRIRAPEAWAISQGEGVIVAVVDTGLDWAHPDIAANVWINAGEDLDGNGRVDESDFNGIDDDGNGYVDDLRGYDFADSADVDEDGRWDGPEDVIDPDPFDEHGHGTHVAGIVAAVADNGIGVAGVAPRAAVMPLKGFTADGLGLDSVLWQAVLYAAANGARVVNNSWSCLPECPVNPLAEEVVDLVHAMGVVVVTSAGNLSRDVVRNSPESSRKVITVASSGEDDGPSVTFSNTGWLLDVAAPGGGPPVVPGVYVARRNILSLRASAHEEAVFAVSDDYLRYAGTSMAAPHVAGVVALLLSHRPELGPEAVRRILRETATDLGPLGHDRYMGAGRLDALAALEGAVLPDLDAAITGPRPGATRSPADGPIRVVGRADGRDLSWWQVSYGRGTDPDAWIPIAPPSSAAVQDDVLVEWDVREREVGTYVLRLDVYGRVGHHYEEFLPISLEYAHLAPISSPGPDALSPDVSGRFVVWQSRRGEETDALGLADIDLFVTDLATGTEHAIQAAPGDQRAASISTAPALVSWLDDRGTRGDPEPYACALEPGTFRCAEVAVAPGAVVRQPPTSAAGRSVWLEPSGGSSELRACRMDGRGGRCEDEPLGLVPGPKALVASDGERLVWTDFSSGQRFGTCRLGRRRIGCAAVTTTSNVFALSRGAASDGLLAFVRFDQRGDHPLEICELDPETGACTPLRIASGVTDATPDLSGNRLVWDHRVGDEAGDVFFCEYDAVRRRCPVQRLTAQMGVQRGSSIDGQRVVWEDDRDGAVRIYGTVLPRLAPIRDRRVREGQWLHVPVRVHAGRPQGDGFPRLDAEAVGDRSLGELGMWFVDRGNGTAWLSWRTARGSAGQYAVTFEATTRERLVTRHTMRIEVVEDPPARRGGPHPWSVLERLLALWLGDRRPR